MIPCIQLKELIIVPVLKSLGLFSPAAVSLLLGTAAQETHMGSYLAQEDIEFGRGGIGIYQIQAATYNHIWDEHVQNDPKMLFRVKTLTGYTSKPPATRLASDLLLSTIIARLYYAEFADPIPTDIKGQANYWKFYYNTRFGEGKPLEFMTNYKLFAYCGDAY